MNKQKTSWIKFQKQNQMQAKMHYIMKMISKIQEKQVKYYLHDMSHHMKYKKIKDQNVKM